MNMLNAAKLKTKLLGGFLLVSLLTLAIGLVGTTKINQIKEDDVKLYEYVTVPLGQIADASIAFQRVRINAVVAVHAKSKAELEGPVERIKRFRAVVTENLEKYEKSIQGEEGRKIYAELKVVRAEYIVLLDKSLALPLQARRLRRRSCCRARDARSPASTRTSSTSSWTPGPSRAS